MVSADKNHNEVPRFVTEASTILKAYGTSPLYTLNLQQLESVFKSWLWQLSQAPPEPPAQVRYLTRKETAERLNISLVTLDKYCMQGKLNKRKIGARYLFDEAEVAAAVEVISKYQR